MLRLHSRSDSGGRRRLWLGAAAAVALLATAAPAHASFAYVANDGFGFEGSVSQYAIGTGGQLAPLAPPTVGGVRAPFGVAASPDGASVYVTDVEDDDVSQYDVGPGGNLSFKSRVFTGGQNAIDVAVSPDGHSAYIANRGSDDVSQYDVGPGGALSPKSPANVAAGDAPRRMALSPDGQSAYVTDVEDDDVSQYDVGSGGKLSPKSPATVAAGDFPDGVAVGRDAKSVYVANGASDTVSQYSVGPSGKLSPKSPATVAAGDGPSGVAVTPNGQSVYVANAASDTVSQYTVGLAGELSPKSPATVATGDEPSGVAITPNGKSVYVTNISGENVSQYDVGPGGALSPKTPATVAAGVGAVNVAVSPPPPQCRMKGGGTFPDAVAHNGRKVRKGDSLSSDMSKPVGPPGSGIAQNLHLEWGPPADPTKNAFRLTTKLTLAQCIDTAGIDPGQGQRLDTLLAEGQGTVNGSPGFHIRIRLTDGGESPSGSGRLKDLVRVKITRASTGRQRLHATGRLRAGNQDARDGA